MTTETSASRADDFFEVEEVFTEHPELIVLSLGFASAHDPLDVLHFACGHQRSGRQPSPVEDLLYVERTDQSLACDGREVVGLTGYGDHIELRLTGEGARLLGLAPCTLFGFNAHPELRAPALAQIEAMARAGQPNVGLA
ncbi:hypothetical protein [Paenacidovorax monticola]|uniref:Uncharacterized protein n=1 Tax=Paenacidovorax monticola TaxID=1926868 RepID=A0A7H0HJ81_9BURK|nr:hypothetical protein [Paenacidovorax monticola]QNP60597.1 hypothetical protein H9L24_07200 [Paenacidovorax monticola]